MSSFFDVSDVGWDFGVLMGILVGCALAVCCFACLLRSRSKAKAAKRKAGGAPGGAVAGGDPWAARVQDARSKRKGSGASRSTKASPGGDDRLASLLEHQGAGAGDVATEMSYDEFNREMLASFLSVMADGVDCMWHRNGAMYKNIRLALKGSDKLVWGSQGKKPKNSMFLSTVVAVRSGSGSPQFAPSASPEKCLSLLCRDGSSLDIEVNTVLERDGIVEGMSMAVEMLGTAEGGGV